MSWRGALGRRESPGGQPLAQWGAEGGHPGQFERPGGIAIDRQGNLYVADTGNGRIQKLALNSQSLAQRSTKLPAAAAARYVEAF